MKFNLRANNNKERFSVGLDIGTDSVKAVKLRFNKNEAELCNFALEPIGIETPEVIKKIAQSFGAETVNLGIGGSATIIRYAVFPRMSREELKRAIKFEAQKHIPFSVPETNVDSYVLQPDLPDNKMFVLLAAAKKDFVNLRLKVIEDAGLKVNIIDVDSLALINAFNFNYPVSDNPETKAIALLNIGAAVSNLNILENGISRFSRDIHIAGNNFTHKIMDILSLDLKAAEKEKFKPETNKMPKLTAAIELVLSNLVGELRTSFDFYESQNTSSLKKIFLSGGSSFYAGLQGMLSNMLGMEVGIWDPLKNISFANETDREKAKAVAGQLAVAIGLGLR